MQASQHAQHGLTACAPSEAVLCAPTSRLASRFWERHSPPQGAAQLVPELLSQTYVLLSCQLYKLCGSMQRYAGSSNGSTVRNMSYVTLPCSHSALA